MSETEAYEITVACGEAAANAIAHARTDGDAHFESTPGFPAGTSRSSCATPARWKPPADGDSSFGLLLMERLMDSVEIRRGESGTEVSMRRRLRAPALR